MKCNFTIEEIQLASEIGHKYQTHYEFLQREWNTYIERTSFRVNQLGEEFHREKRMNGSIGRPKRKEIVRVLIEEHGDCEKAARKCFENRINLVCLKSHEYNNNNNNLIVYTLKENRILHNLLKIILKFKKTRKYIVMFFTFKIKDM